MKIVINFKNNITVSDKSPKWETPLTVDLYPFHVFCSYSKINTSLPDDSTPEQSLSSFKSLWNSIRNSMRVTVSYNPFLLNTSDNISSVLKKASDGVRGPNICSNSSLELCPDLACCLFVVYFCPSQGGPMSASAEGLQLKPVRFTFVEIFSKLFPLFLFNRILSYLGSRSLWKQCLQWKLLKYILMLWQNGYTRSNLQWIAIFI